VYQVKNSFQHTFSSLLTLLFNLPRHYDRLAIRVAAMYYKEWIRKRRKIL